MLFLYGYPNRFEAFIIVATNVFFYHQTICYSLRPSFVNMVCKLMPQGETINAEFCQIVSDPRM